MRAPEREGKSGSWNCCPIVHGIRSPCTAMFTPRHACNRLQHPSQPDDIATLCFVQRDAFTKQDRKDLVQEPRSCTKGYYKSLSFLFSKEKKTNGVVDILPPIQRCTPAKTVWKLLRYSATPGSYTLKAERVAAGLTLKHSVQSKATNQS